MYLVEILLPTSDNAGVPFRRGLFRAVQEHLTEAFGGVTAFIRSPGEGISRSAGQVEKDQVVVIEVMTSQIDDAWWREYRGELERTFRQREIVIRSHSIRLL